MKEKDRKRGQQKALAAVAGSVLALAAGLFAAVALTNQSASASSTTCANAGGDGQHYVLGPCGYDKGNDTLIVAGSSVPTLGDGDHVVICHALGEDNKDTYIQIAPSAGVVFGHAGSGHQLGQDIIPPFKYVSNSGQTEDDSLQNGQNWDAAHIAIYNNGCSAVTSTTTGTTTTGTTTTGTTTSTTPGGTTTVTTPGQTTTVTVPGQTTTVTTPGQTTTVTTPGQTTTNTQTVTNTQTTTVTTPTQTVTTTTPGPTQTVTNTVTVTTPGKVKVVVKPKVIVHNHTKVVVKKVKVPTKGHLAYTK